MLRSVRFSADGSRLVTESANGSIWIWDTASGRAVASPRFSEYEAIEGSVPFFFDGGTLAFLKEQTIFIWDVATAEQKVSFSGGPFGRFAVDPTGRFFVQSDWTEVTVYDLVSGNARYSLEFPKQTRNRQLAFSPDGCRLAITGYEVRIFDLASGAEVSRLTELGSYTGKIVFSEDGKRVATCVEEPVRVWDVETGRLLATYCDHDLWAEEESASPDGKWVARIVERSITLADAASGTVRVQLPEAKSRVIELAWSRNGQYLLTRSAFQGIQVWDVHAAAEVGRLREREITEVLSPSGSKVAELQDNGTLLVWDSAGAEIANLTVKEARIEDLSFAADGRRLVYQTDGESICIWDEATGRRLPTVAGCGDVQAAAAGHRCLAIRFDETRETVIVDSELQTPIAWFPAELRPLDSTPACGVWAGAANNHIHIIGMEGVAAQGDGESP
jgi:WD40 repeat protein